MDSFEIVWKNSAHRELGNLDRQLIPRIVHAVGLLAENPCPPQSRKLRGSDRDFRIRIGDYRVIYQIDAPNRLVTICHVRHRSIAYRE
jgi:mRNA interferase RelE/StbE